MLLNPYTTPLPISEGTRALHPELVWQLGVVGARVFDPKEPWRVWTLQWLYAPVAGRRLGGIRAKFTDDAGYVTYCNQRDLEVLLGRGIAGKRCTWLRDEYCYPESPDWYGLCADSEDLADDLYERELQLRHSMPDPCTPLAPYTQLARLVHYDEGNDVTETFMLLRDTDVAFENVLTRWTRVDKQRNS